MPSIEPFQCLHEYNATDQNQSTLNVATVRRDRPHTHTHTHTHTQRQRDRVPENRLGPYSGYRTALSDVLSSLETVSVFYNIGQKFGRRKEGNRPHL